MAIRPILHGPLADDVSGRIASGYLYIDAQSAVDADTFPGAEPGTLKLVITNFGSGTGLICIVPQVYGDGTAFSGSEPGAAEPVTFNPARLAGKGPTGYVARISTLETQVLEQSISIAHSVEFIKAIPRELTDTLTLTDDVNLESEISKQDQIDLSQTIEVNVIREISLSDSLGLSDALIPGENIEEELSDTLTLTDVATGNLVIEQSVSDDLTLSHAIEPVLITGHFNFAESGTWECPAGVSTVTIEAWGGGGGSGANKYGGGGGGGAGGAFSRKVVSVTPGVTYTVNVGTGGTGATAGNDNATAGGDTWFFTSGTVLAKGGNPGNTDYDDGGTIPGAGGTSGSQIALGVGDTKYRGGAGAFGGATRGGSSAGTAANGLDGYPPGGSPPTGAGAGGAANTAGSIPGGGAGGRNATLGGGYAGAAGYLTLIYVPPNETQSDLTVSQTVEINFVKTRELSDTLTLTDAVELDDESTYKQDTLEFTETLTVTVVRSFSFEDTLSIAEDAVPGAVTFENHSDDLTLSDVFIDEKVYVKDHSDTLTLTDALVQNIIRNISFSDSVAITDTEAGRNLQFQDLHQEIALGQTPATRMIPKVNLSHTLDLLVQLGYSPRFELSSDTLALLHTVYHNLVQHGFADSLTLSQTVTINFERSISFEDSLTLADESYRTAREAIDHTLSLSDELRRVDDIQSTLVLTHGFTVEQAKSIIHALALVSTFQTNLVLNLSTTQALSLGHSAIAIVDQHETCTYSPISTVLPGAPTLTKATHVTYTCGASTLTLRSPAIGDNEDQVFQRIVKESIGGSLKHYRQSGWPKSRTLTYKFDNLDAGEYATIATFLKASLGLQVTLVDYWGRSWVGVITNPDSVYVEESRATRSITIKLQGVLT